MLLTIRIAGESPEALAPLTERFSDEVHEVALPHGKAILFYPELSPGAAELALLMDLDPLSPIDIERPFSVLAHGRAQTVNDRAYTASAFLAQAIIVAFAELIESAPAASATAAIYPLRLSVSTVTGAPATLTHLLAITDLACEIREAPPETNRAAGEFASPVDIVLTGNANLAAVLLRLALVLLAVDPEKEYWLGQPLVDALWQTGQATLTEAETAILAPEFFRMRPQTFNVMVKRIAINDPEDPSVAFDRAQAAMIAREAPLELTEKRHELIESVLLHAEAQSVLDLNPGDGHLTARLLRQPGITRVTNLDVDYKAIQRSANYLNQFGLTPEEVQKVTLYPGSPLYRDPRSRGHDAVVLAEWMQMVPRTRLNGLEMSIFHYVQPATAIFTTPNAEYNRLLPDLAPGGKRHAFHHFEWTRAEFKTWAEPVAEKFACTIEILPIGPPHPEWGAPNQMAVFTRKRGKKP
ncbi:MAG: hypothetical protein AAF998_24190 [Bacteroidota bacterium]